MLKILLIVLQSLLFNPIFSQILIVNSPIKKNYNNSTFKITNTKKKYQTKIYNDLILEADSLYNIKKYRKSVLLYEKAFTENGNKGRVSDRLNAARCYAKIGNGYGAFYQLFRIVEKFNYSDYQYLISEHIFDPMHAYEKWNRLIEKAIQNNNKIGKNSIKESELNEENYYK
jgi:predicted amidohydrolase